MPNPDLIPEPFAQSGDKNPIPLERAISDPVYRASWKVGFPPDTRIPKDIGGEAPDGLDFNGVLNILSQAVVFLQKGNAYQFDPALAPYPIGALVRSNDNLTTYQSTIAANSNNPNSNMTGWRVYNSSEFIVDNLTTNDSTKTLSAKQGKALQDNKLEKTDLKDASTTQKGVVRAATATEVANKSNVNAYVTPSNTALIAQSTDIGAGQSWQNLTASRSSGTTYTNSTLKPIYVWLSIYDTNGSGFSVVINGVTIISSNWDLPPNGYYPFNFIVPAGHTYNVTWAGGNSQLISWSELR